MTVLLSSGDLAEILTRLNQKKISYLEAQDRIIKLVEPLIEFVSTRHPLYIREDLKQELRIGFMNRIKDLAHCYCSGRINGNLVGYVGSIFKNDATTWVSKQLDVDCKFVRIDDVKIEPVIYPKTYEKSKLIKKIRKAIDAFYRNRYPKEKDAKRASQFAYAILEGKRPNFDTNNLTRFFNGNRINAQQAYTTALVAIKMVLEQYEEEIQCILEK